MSGFDSSYKDRYDEHDPGWDNAVPPEGNFNSRHYNSRFMNSQYSEAFGDYRGGYGPNGGFGPPRMRPYPPRGPPRGPPHPPLGFGPMRPPPRRGPAMHRAAQFLTECQVAPQYIRILPRELLDLIEPDFCGLCSQNLDTYAVAKLHYNCKNHYKAQKKFMAQYKPMKNGSFDVPMKARNIYCELCDVQITSISHADSHYAGRSHRAIVEGRKPPKNPILLQNGMEARVEQLIRREKKNPPKKPDPAELEELAVSIDKNVTSELFCEICKTCVTCSEQMTSHLNGKKHLTKEKQHILNMMKGKANANDNGEKGNKGENGQTTQEGEEVNEKESVQTTQEDAVEKSVPEPEADSAEDWGSGDGADWDVFN